MIARVRFLIAAPAGIASTSCGDIQSLQGFADILASGTSTSADGNVAACLKEALRVGSERAAFGK